MSFSNFLQKFNQLNYLSVFLLILYLLFFNCECLHSKNQKNHRLLSSTKHKKLAEESPSINWTKSYSAELASFALDFASAAYAEDPTPCLEKHNAKLEKVTKLPCDYLNDKVSILYFKTITLF